MQTYNQLQQIKMFPSSNIIGPADFFNYNYPTNHIMQYIAGPFAMLLLKAFRVRVEGLENIPRDTNIILMPNHISHADSFFAVANIWRHKPFHFIADEKLFRSRWFRNVIAGLFNVFPVRKMTKDLKIVEYAIARARLGNNLLWFPEGARHKNPSENRCNKGKLGSGILAHGAKGIPIIPVFLYGPEFTMPVGGKFWFGKRFHSIDILVRYGPPVYLDDLRALPKSRDVSQQVVDRIMSAIEKLRPKSPYYDQSNKI